MRYKRRSIIEGEPVPQARLWVFRILVTIILLELAQLGVHYFKPFV